MLKVTLADTTNQNTKLCRPCLFYSSIFELQFGRIEQFLQSKNLKGVCSPRSQSHSIPGKWTTSKLKWPDNFATVPNVLNDNIQFWLNTLLVELRHK